MAENKKVTLGGVEITLVAGEAATAVQSTVTGAMKALNLATRLKIVAAAGLPVEPVKAGLVQEMAMRLIQVEWHKAFPEASPAEAVKAQKFFKQRSEHYKAELEFAKANEEHDVIGKAKKKSGSTGGAVREAQRYQLTQAGVEQLAKKELTAQRFIVARTVQLLGCVPDSKKGVTFKQIAEGQKEYEGIKAVPEKNVQFHCNAFLNEDLFAKVDETGLPFNKPPKKTDAPASTPAAPKQQESQKKGKK